MPVLEKLGVKDDFLKGNIKCPFCDEVITMENLYSFFLETDKLKMVCSKDNCVGRLKAKE